MSTLQHGHGRRGARTLEYESWVGIRKRCQNPKDKLYSYYGGRGILVCEEWCGAGGFEAFLEHVGMAPTPQHSIDRIDNNKGYEPGNVRWATKKEQARNRRSTFAVTIDGETKSLAEWAELHGAPYKIVWARIKNLGWSVERALGPSPYRKHKVAP